MENGKTISLVKDFSWGKSDFLTAQALAFLSPRNQKVLALFFGLEGKNQSLSSIGKKMGITRERVRQIKTESLKKIKKNFKKINLPEWEEFCQKIEELFCKEGGFLEVQKLGQLVDKNYSAGQLGQINLLLSLNGENFSFEKKSLKIKSFWLWKGKIDGQKISREEINSALEVLLTFLKEKNLPLRQSELAKKGLVLLEKFSLETELGKKRVENLLTLSIVLGKNILGQWGFLSWPVISSNITRERAYLVLKKNKQSMHFRNIAQLIKEYWPKKRVVLQTVHNELIKDSRFILTGRGVYSLSEWKEK